jgi:DNA polymerase III gamma/tau subunit
MPVQVRNKVYILDEAHQLTNDAQSSLLKELEEAPGHVFIILCSTHPKKILPTVKNRCQRFKFSSLRKSEMLSLLEEIATYEGEEIVKSTLEAIVDAAAGSPRNAIVLLQQVIQLGSKDKAAILRLLNSEDQENANVFAICFALDKGKLHQWGNVIKQYQEAAHIGAPGIGMMIAGYYRNQLIKTTDFNRAELCSGILDLFSDPFPEGKLGENKLILNLYKAYKIARR